MPIATQVYAYIIGCLHRIAPVTTHAASLHPTSITFLSILEPSIMGHKPNLSILFPLKDYINM